MKPSLIIFSISILLTLFTANNSQAQAFPVWNFFYPDDSLQKKVDVIYQSLNDEQRVGQLVILSVGTLGKPTERVLSLAKKGQLGGVIYLGGTEKDFLNIHSKLVNANTSGIPLLFSLDAEPTLLPRKMSSVDQFISTSDLTNANMVDSAVKALDSIINRVNVKMNFAPVTDLSPNNEVIGKRSFGSDPKHVFDMNLAFCLRSIQDGIVPVIKHFPGHGFVQGDSHKKLVYIENELKELNVFRALMASGMPAVMVGHIAINNGKYATQGLPATLSKNLVTDLIRDSLSYNGIVITDALNMGALSEWPDAPFMALQAGCDLILMPIDEQRFIERSVEEIKKDKAFALQVERSVKKIILLKLLLNLPFNY